MDKKIYAECPNCGNDISVELGEHDKLLRKEVTEECINKFANILSSASTCAACLVDGCNWNNITVCEDMYKKWILSKLKEK